MSPDEHIINLDLPPEQRWEFLKNYQQEVNDLLACYLSDFGDYQYLFEGVNAFKESIIPEEYLREIAFIASISNFSEEEVLIANLYYDVLKFYLGCTAFACESNGSVLHARNLDWWTKNNLLSRHSRIFNFQKKGETVFKSVGWIGFTGVLSGVKPQSFSITLNAVLSNDSPEFAMPVTFLLREVLTLADSFSEAKTKLETTTIASDCLLLLSGTTTKELVVIERTPKRFATRTALGNSIAVTNDYKSLENKQTGGNLLQTTSCGRYDQTCKLLVTSPPDSAAACLKILKDDEVMMGITVQQMVFNNATGAIKLIKT
ncbi:MAG: C45 family autoproteolytic acyltransferase/hydrolase [Bacteroidota bacterium]